MNELIKQYLERTLTIPMAIGDVEQYLSLHASGQLDAALTIAGDGDAEWVRKLPKDLKDFVSADLNLIRAKLGRKPDLGLKVDAAPYAAFVHEYALFTHFFWVDHVEAVACLRRMLRYSIRLLRVDFLLMTIFLVAHLRTIANARLCSLGTASVLYLACIFLRKRGVLMSPFAHDIVIATFPYTNYVRADFKGMDRSIARSQRWLSNDPYYNLLFSITYLYHAAYSGNIVDTERTVALFKALQERGKLLRYRPVTILMGILPFCIRGYEHVVRDQFERFVADYDRNAHDILINSQVFRISAIVYIALGEYPAAQEAIDTAVEYRKQASFNSWTHVDEKIKKVIDHKKDIEEIFGTIGTTADQTAYLKSGFVISKLVDQLAQVTGDLDELAARAADVIAKHLDVPACIGALPDSKPWQLPVILFGKQTYFYPEDQLKYEQTKQLLEILLPPVRSIEATALRLKMTQDKLKDQEKLAAIASTTQMLAHDVRRPFSLLEGIIQKIQDADASSLRGVAQSYLPEVRKSLAAVNSMIEDMMEVGRSDAASEKTQPMDTHEALVLGVATVLTDVIATAVGSDNALISVEQHLMHSKNPAIDAVKFARVLTNLIDNAVQAMGGPGGKLWIRTQDIEHPSGAWIGFTVGNSNSYIPEEDLPRLFDAFYTKNKDGGTGLGLAIVKKIVSACGGEITCDSSVEHGTQFHFTLPASTVEGQHVVVVDDCPFVRSQWADLASLQKVIVFSSPDEFWDAVKRDDAVMREALGVVTDFFFDNQPGYTGLDFAGSIRDSGYRGPLLIASDAPVNAEAAAAVRAVITAKKPTAALAAVSGIVGQLN